MSDTLAIFSNVSIVGLGLFPASILTIVFKDKSASFESWSCEIPFSCLNFFIFLAMFDFETLFDIVLSLIYHLNVWDKLYFFSFLSICIVINNEK